MPNKARLKLGALLFAMAWVISAREAAAATATTTFGVTANVVTTCSITATNLDSGLYSGVKVNATSTLNVQCSTGTPWQISLSAGLGPGATANSRKMAGPTSDILNYQLSSKGSQSFSWGDTPPINTLPGTGTGAVQEVTVFGVIFAGQFVASDAYSDTITATVTF